MSQNSDELYNEIIAAIPEKVRLMLAQIEKLINKEVEIEDYEDAARLRDMKKPFEKFINGELTYDDIKDDLSFAGSKFSTVIDNAFAKAMKGKKL